MYDESAKDVNNKNHLREIHQHTKYSCFLIGIGSKYKDKETMRNEQKKQYETCFAVLKKSLMRRL